MVFPQQKSDPSRRARLALLLLLLLGLACALQLWLGAASSGEQEPATAVGTPGSQDAQEPALLVQRARDLVAAGQSEQALTLLGRGGANRTEETVVYYRGLLEFDRANAYPISLDPLSGGRYAAPVEAVRRAALRLADAGAADGAYRQLLKADLFRRLGERELAEALLAPLLRARPDYRDAWLAWGELLLATGEMGRAHEAFARAEQLDPDSREALAGLIRSSESAGDAASAGLYRARLEQLAPK